MASPLQLAQTSCQYRLKAPHQPSRPHWEQPIEAPHLDEMNAAEAAIATGRTDELPKYLTDRWLNDCTLYGPAARIREGVEEWRDAGITTPVLVPLSPDGNQMNGLKTVFDAFER